MSLLLRSGLLERAGFRHGFSLRAGGVSAPPFDSLNLARNVGDAPEAVAENHARFASAVGYSPTALYEVSQVHGRAVHRVDPACAPAAFRAREGDALLTTQRDFAVGVRVADCVPILIAHPRSGAVAAVHAGWRGVVARILEASIEALCEDTGALTAELLIAIGPHIGPLAFEVSQDVASEIAESAARDPSVIVPREPRPHVNLARAVENQLLALGVQASHLEHVTGCTFSDASRFFSFRRDGKASGRHLAVIVAGC